MSPFEGFPATIQRTENELLIERIEFANTFAPDFLGEGLRQKRNVDSLQVLEKRLSKGSKKQLFYVGDSTIRRVVQPTTKVHVVEWVAPNR